MLFNRMRQWFLHWPGWRYERGFRGWSVTVCFNTSSWWELGGSLFANWWRARSVMLERFAMLAIYLGHFELNITLAEGEEDRG